MSTLSREQVERAYIGLLNDASIKGQIGLTTTIVLLSAHDANLRALLRQREEALDLVKATCDSKDWYMARQGESFEALRQHGIMLDAQLAAMTAERDEAREIIAKANNTLLGSCGYFTTPSFIDKIDDLKTASNRFYSQLAASQARCAQLEEALRDIFEGRRLCDANGTIGYWKNGQWINLTPSEKPPA